MFRLPGTSCTPLGVRMHRENLEGQPLKGMLNDWDNPVKLPTTFSIGNWFGHAIRCGCFSREAESVVNYDAPPTVFVDIYRLRVAMGGRIIVDTRGL